MHDDGGKAVPACVCPQCVPLRLLLRHCKDEAKRKAPSFCEGGWGITVACQTEILDIEHIPKEK